MKKQAVFALIVLLLVGGGCSKRTDDSLPSDQTAPVVLDRGSIIQEAKENGLIMKDDEVELMKTQALELRKGTTMTNVSAFLDLSVKGWTSAALADVTGGDSFGLAHAHFENGLYTFISKMGNLPDPAEGYFYEGWLVVRADPFSVLSIGHAVKTADGYAIVYQLPEDLSDHTFFVLTLEPDDGNQAPEEHILEGTFR